MHYCFLTTGSWEGNASYVRLREFGNELIARGVRVSYILDDRPYNREKLKLHEKAERFWISRPGGLMQFIERRKLLRQINADFVHHLNPSIKPYLALIGMRSQRSICDWDEWPARRQGVYRWYRVQLERYLDYWFRRRSFIRVVASKFLQREFAALGYDSDYIPYAAYLQPYRDGAAPFSEPTFVYVGNLYISYDHDLLFEAARILKSRGKTPAIAICGNGPDMDKWRAFIKQHDLTNVALPGFLSGEMLWRYMRHARALLFPIRENVVNLARCPSKTFAYMQARRPVLAGHVGEVVESLGDKATYVAPDATAWADAIDAVPLDPPHVDWGVEQHNWSDRADRLLAAIRAREQHQPALAARASREDKVTSGSRS